MNDLAEFMHSAAGGGKLPLYQQLQQALRRAIDEGAWGSASAIPAERQLASALGISRITVRKAIDAKTVAA